MANSKKLLFSITKDDFEMQTFTCGTKGGGGKDTNNSGVRLIHRASSAVGEGREERHQIANKRRAFERLVNTNKFQAWHKLECARRMGQRVSETPEQIRERVDRMVDEGLRDDSIVIEEIPGDGVSLSVR